MVAFILSNENGKFKMLI